MIETVQIRYRNNEKTLEQFPPDSSLETFVVPETEGEGRKKTFFPPEIPALQIFNKD